jgi:transposase
MNTEWMSDARKIPDEAMSYIRQIAVHAIVDQHYSPKLISRIFRIGPSSVYDWIRRYRRDGESALETGQAPGASPTITPRMDRWLKKTILTSIPTDYGYDTPLWTLKIPVALLELEFGIRVVQSTVANHLHRMRLSCQIPEYRARDRDPQETANYLEKKWVSIQHLANKINADIAFEDEAGIAIMTRTGRTWGNVNSPPRVLATDQRGGYNALSAITTTGRLYYRMTDNNINSDSYIDFLGMILSKQQRPLIVIADRATIHRSKKVHRFVRDRRRRIRMFFLPKHAPEFNPDEQVWNVIKHRQLGRQPILNKEDLRQRIKTAFHALQQNTQKILSFYRLESTRYVLN